MDGNIKKNAATDFRIGIEEDHETVKRRIWVSSSPSHEAIGNSCRKPVIVIANCPFIRNTDSRPCERHRLACENGWGVGVLASRRDGPEQGKQSDYDCRAQSHSAQHFSVKRPDAVGKRGYRRSGLPGSGSSGQWNETPLTNRAQREALCGTTLRSPVDVWTAA